MSYEPYTQNGSAKALDDAVRIELDREDLHRSIEVSYVTESLSNGIKRCSVQVECKAGCGYLVEAFGEEADMLREKAAAIQNMLSRGVPKNSSWPLFEAPRTLSRKP